MRKQKKGLKTILLVLMLAGIIPAYGQIHVTLGVNQPASLVAAAGLDQLICPEDSALLGASPAALNGTSPYTYAWSPTTAVGNPTAGNTMASPVASTGYILTVTDVNGCTAMDTVTVTVDTCVGISPGAWTPALALYPNPNQGSFTLALDQLNGATGLKVEIWTLTGQMIYSDSPKAQAGRIESRIDISAYGKGTYLVKVTSSEGSTIHKMVVQ